MKYTYKLEDFFGTFVIRRDSAEERSMYLKNVRNGEYTWTRDALYARGFSRTSKTALNHIFNLTSAQWNH